MPDDLSSLLSPIRERSAKAVPGFSSNPGTYIDSAADVPRLLAAVEAALKLADKLEPQGPSASALEEDRMWIRQECAGMIREVITTALTGEEAK